MDGKQRKKVALIMRKKDNLSSSIWRKDRMYLFFKCIKSVYYFKKKDAR